MTAITPVIRAGGDGIPGMTEKGRSERQSMIRDQSLQVRRHSIDRSNTVPRSVSISNPSINIPEAGGIGRRPLTQAEIASQAFSFGPFRIVPRARLLERDGSRIPVGSRAFDLLCVLVSRAGEVVSKGELMARVWPDLTVEEGNLRVHIAQLRRTLGDDQAAKRYVTNVPGRGYCFVARVDRTASPYIQHLHGSRFMLAGQRLSRPEESVSGANDQVPLQTSAEFVRTYHAQAHEIADAITAAVTNAQAGLNWLNAQPLDLEEVRKALNSIVNDGKRACEIVVRLRALMNKVPTVDGAP